METSMNPDRESPQGALDAHAGAGPALRPAGPLLRLAAWFVDAAYLAFPLAFVLVAMAVSRPPGSRTSSAVAAVLVTGWLFRAVTESSRAQATPGKVTMGLRVVDLEGRRLGFWRASLRYLGRCAAAAPLLLGFALVGLTPRRQGLHDFVAGTLVDRHQPVVAWRVGVQLLMAALIWAASISTIEAFWRAYR
jgi:uncharacterized RDD family membrane protein YckC